MTMPRLDPRIEQRARDLAKEIGDTFRRERCARGDRQRDIAEYLGAKPSNTGSMTVVERRYSPNMMIGTALRYLNIYGYTLAVVPITKNTEAKPGVAALVSAQQEDRR